MNIKNTTLGAMSLVLLLSCAGCATSRAAPQRATTFDTQAQPYEQQVHGLHRQARDLLEEISSARTERAVMARIRDYSSWVLRDDERIGLANHNLITEAVRRNPHIMDGVKLEEYFFDVNSVWPADCTSNSHAALERRISDMQLLARACDRGELVSALEDRREFLRKTRNHLDGYGVCSDTRRAGRF